MRRNGLALIIVVGILGVLALLAVAFVAMAQLERRASQQRINAARAYLLARSGIEDALARLDAGQDPSSAENRYLGEDFDASGTQNGIEVAAEVYQRGVLNTDDCPVRQALRPSFYVRDRVSVVSPQLPALQPVEGRVRGYSGRLSGDYASEGNTYALKVSSSNAGIYINGGALDDKDRDPDGPGVEPNAAAMAFPLNPNAATEVAPLQPNGVPDYQDASMEGPNGFLVRLLNNLDAVVTNGAMSNLGAQVVDARPLGGYKSLEELKPVLGQSRLDQFKPTLTLHAWVDPKVVKPQPMDGRPHRWQDIDDTHRIGTEAQEISGVSVVGGGNIQLKPGIRGGETGPWSQDITVTNAYEDTRDYPVGWERNFVYAWSQLRPAPIALEPRAPIAVNGASKELLATVFLGLKGTYLEVWDGSAGWEGGFGWCRSWGNPGYPYPDQATEETPWIRTRVDYGMTYGSSQRPWYGPRDYKPGADGRPQIQTAPLGRLKETPPLSREQALAVASQVRAWISDLGPFRTWTQFNIFVEVLASWEDLNDDGVLDGEPYQVNSHGEVYTRRMYQREDLDSDGRMRREIFASNGEGWRQGPPPWQDPGLGREGLGQGQVPGLTFLQKDVLRAMANPNTDLNDFNPDANLFKEADKEDLCGAVSIPSSYVHTTELSLEPGADGWTLRALGRLTGRGGRLLASRQLGLVAGSSGKVFRDTTQADFMGAYRPGGQLLSALFQGPLTAYPLAGGQPLVSYPEPLTAADAAYDGQISLGFVGSLPGPDETLRGDLFDTVDATESLSPDPSVPDLRGPFRKPLLSPADSAAGNVFPDGVYAERDRSLQYTAKGNFPTPGFLNVTRISTLYIACWMKPAWFPEASPRAHALVSLSQGRSGAGFGWGPTAGMPFAPLGLYFLPARNNAPEMVYKHNGNSNGRLSPQRALVWGRAHNFFGSGSLNRRGIEIPLSRKPMGRLEGHRWVHVAMTTDAYNPYGLSAGWTMIDSAATKILMGRSPASLTGGGWSRGGTFNDPELPHRDGTANHLRFGEIAAATNMNYAADATFACVRSGIGRLVTGSMTALDAFFTGPFSPVGLGRYLKEHGAAYVSSKLPAGLAPHRVTWTEIPCDLWFDENGDDWLGDDTLGAQVRLRPYAGFWLWDFQPWIERTMGLEDGSLRLEEDTDQRVGVAAPQDYLRPRNDRFTLTPAGASLPVPNGKRDVRIDLEIWHDLGTASAADDVRLAVFDDPAADNRIPQTLAVPWTGLSVPLPPGRLYYKAVFVNEWDATTRANYPLDVTPFLDDVTISFMEAGGPKVIAYTTAGDDE